MRRSLAGASLGCAAVVLASSLQAQATLSGIVRHDSTGAPLAGVEVLITTTPHRTETGTDGRYTLSGLPAGVYQAIFRKVGYLPVRVDVRLASSETTRANTTLIESAVVLDPVIVTGSPENSRGVGVGREAMEERRRLGFGKFFDAEYLRRVDSHLHLDDVFRREGVQTFDMRTSNGHIWAAFNSIRRDNQGKFNCVMQVYYNGAPVGKGGILDVSVRREDVIDLRTFPLSSLEAAEVYRSAGEVPGEYGGPNAGCGVILLWSRVNP